MWWSSKSQPCHPPLSKYDMRVKMSRKAGEREKEKERQRERERERERKRKIDR